MFYSQVILAKKGPLAKVWLAAHWGDKKLARPQIFATDISASVDTIVNPTMPLALRLSGHLLLGVVRIYSRKVKYVLSDCTEAMLKLQMAFASASGPNNPNAKGKELLDPSSTGAAMTGMGPHHTTIVDFGEYDQVHVVEDFCLPLPDQSEWILCEDDEEEEHGRGEQGEVVGHHARMSLPVPTAAASPMAKYQPPQEETWVPFDPDHEDEEDDLQQQQEGQQELSQVSDVEIVRAAGDSFLSNDETRRASSLLGKSQTLLDTSLPEQQQRQNDKMEEEEDVDFAHVPFEDDADEAAMAMDTTPDQQPPRDSSLLLHLSDDVSALDTSATIGFGAGGEDSSMTGKRKSTMTNDGDEDNDNDETTDAPPQRIKRRKRRKVIIDNDATELSNEHIRDMLADTSDLIARQPHPADSLMREDYDEEAVDDANQNKDRSQLQDDKGFVVPSLTQPFLADSGYLHPSLTRLWKQNFYRALDLPCPFETIELHDDVEQVLQEQQPQDQQAMGDEGEENTDMETSSLMQAGSDDKKDDAGDENEQESPDDFVPPPMDEEGEEEEEDDGPIVPNLDDDSEQEQVVPHRATTGRSSSIGDLGLVNELELEDEDEDDIDDPEQREALGEHVGNKWHKHTVKVLKLLQSRLRTLDSDEDDDEEQEASKPTFLEFGELAKNVNRRTAASCFMECLQLKTWDFLELVQDEEYGPITITAGPRFHEAPPNEA